MRAYKIRKFQNGRDRSGAAFYNYALTVPTEIAEQLPNGIKYECIPTDEGLLFKPQNAESDKPRLPAWAQQAPQNGGTKPARRRQRPGAKQPVEA